MNKNSRTTNVIRNIIGGVGGQIFTSILMFVCRTYFIKLLGAKYLGVNGLFSNVLSMLSLAELGIGPAIVFSMYKPIAQNDEMHVAKLMNFYKTAYRLVAGIVLVVGLSLVPFLNVLIKGDPGVTNLKLIFILILSNTVVSYLLAYKGSMLSADQKAYVGVIIKNIFAVVQNVSQIVVLVLTGNFILYLVVQIITTFIANLVQAVYVNKKYPFLVTYKKEKIEKAERKDIVKRVRGMMMHKIGGFVLNSTDNLVISKFVGVIAVGIYSNYFMIINLVKGYVSHITAALSASVGNLIASESSEKTYSVFNVTLFVHFWIYGFITVCFWTLFKPFITLWIGESYVLSGGVLFLVIMNFYLTGVQGCIDTYTNATGLFWETRFKPIFECVINLVVSIVLAKYIGMLGVFIGTLASYLCTFWVNPIVVFKKQFKSSPLPYFLKLFTYTVISVGTAFGLNLLCNLIWPSVTIINFILRILFCVIGCNAVFAAILFYTAEFKSCLKLVTQTLFKK